MNRLSTANQAGISIVEFSITLIIIVLLLGGVIDYGLAVVQRRMLADITQSYSRYLDTLSPSLGCDGLKDASIFAKYLENGIRLSGYPQQFEPIKVKIEGDDNDFVEEDGVEYALLHIKLTRKEGACILCVNSILPILPRIEVENVYRVECS